MEQTTFNRIKIEMQSFKGLIITNLVGGAFALAFSIAYAVPKITSLLTEGIIHVNQLPYLGVIILGFIIGINWITKSAELMDEHDEIVKDLDDIDPGDDDAIIGVIVESLAFYRDNQANIRQLSLVSRVVGVSMIAASILQLQAFLTGAYQLGGWMVYAQLFGFISSFGLGLAGLYIPTLLNRFSAKWDARLSSTKDAEEKLDRILQG